ncbi:hypothetical protein ABZX39_08780 [Streptomyces collinus]|uniref:hypothetical protein n=1 Tax=Streptomyces collinus TaxID=42684 RepID=UPI0033B305FF
MTGTNGNDTITGTPGNDVIFALTGNDVVNGAGFAVSGALGADGCAVPRFPSGTVPQPLDANYGHVALRRGRGRHVSVGRSRGMRAASEVRH